MHGAATMASSLSPSPGYPAGSATAPPESEGLPFPRRSRCRTFAGPYIECGIEWDEWVLVEALITSRHRVLEFGARFGTTSCALARAMNNSGHLIAVEPDARIWRFTEDNRRRHQCNFGLWRGTVGPRPLVVGYYHGYDTSTRLAASNETDPRLPNVRKHELERLIGWRFNTLLIDCEGCIRYLFDDGGGESEQTFEAAVHSGNAGAGDMLDGIELILLEHDTNMAAPAWHSHSHSSASGPASPRPSTAKAPTAQDAQVSMYAHYFEKLRQRGFKQIWHTQDTSYPRASWSRSLQHSAWAKPSAIERSWSTVPDSRGAVAPSGLWPPTCQQFAARMARERNWTAKELMCLPLLSTDS